MDDTCGISIDDARERVNEHCKRGGTYLIHPQGTLHWWNQRVETITVELDTFLLEPWQQHAADGEYIGTLREDAHALTRGERAVTEKEASAVQAILGRRNAIAMELLQERHGFLYEVGKVMKSLWTSSVELTHEERCRHLNAMDELLRAVAYDRMVFRKELYTCLLDPCLDETPDAVLASLEQRVRSCENRTREALGKIARNCDMNMQRIALDIAPVGGR